MKTEKLTVTIDEKGGVEIDMKMSTINVAYVIGRLLTIASDRLAVPQSELTKMIINANAETEIDKGMKDGTI